MKSKISFISVIIFAIFNLNTYAQSIEFELIYSPFDDVRSSSVAFADVDNDGDQDVFITGQSSIGMTAKFYRNDGNGNYTEDTDSYFTPVWSSSIAFADIENDGDQDLLITGYQDNNQGVSKLYTNNDSGFFGYYTAISAPLSDVYRSSIAFADVNNDGYQDLLITGNLSYSYGNASLYLNDSTGHFNEITDAPFYNVRSSSSAFADVDNDGDQDLLITGFYNFPKSTLFRNDGSGNYTEDTDASFHPVAASSVAFADIDNDGDQDLLITGQSGNIGVAKLYINDGSGNYTEVTNTPFIGVMHSSIAFSDVDNDGDQDVLITGGNNDSGNDINIAKLYSNDGSGNYTELTSCSFEGVSSGQVAFADIDKDGDQDLLITGENNSGYPMTALWRNSLGETSINTIGSKSALSIYPNPTNTVIYISNYEQNINEVKIVDITGKTIKTLARADKEIDVSYLSRGIYFVKVSDKVLKFVKE